MGIDIRTLAHKMVPLFILVGVLAAVSNGKPPPPDCCESKDVGGVSYSLVGRMDTKAYNCLSDCIYVKDEEPSVKFCFASGDLEVECTQDERPPMEGSERPPMEGSERPPMEGTKKPMEGTKKPMEGTVQPGLGGSTNSSGCKCGVKKGSRIVGGTETTVNEYPWMTAIVSASGESQFCGGTLIASQWVLTAAHCMFKDSQGQNPQTAAEIKALLGEHNLASTGEETIPRKLVTVTQIINHASYDATSSNYDIALLKLSEKVDLNVYTPACLAKSADNFEGKNAWVYGWGTTSFGGASADSLMEVEVPVVSNSVCTAAMGNGITDQMLCAGGQLNKDGCQGDSGGPLTVDSNGQHVLIGDVSFGDGCGQAGKYGVYGDVANLRTWVDEQMTNNGGSEFCPAGADAA